MPTTLDKVPIGQRARVLSVRGGGAVVQRLMEMGVLEGDVIEVLAVAPLGDPMELRVGDYRLSIRRAEAALVEAEIVA